MSHSQSHSFSFRKNLTNEKKTLCKHLIDIMEKKHMRGEEVKLGIFEYNILVDTTHEIIRMGYYSKESGNILNELREKYIKELNARYDK